MKFNAGKNKVRVLNGEEGLECVVSVDRVQLEHVSEFKYSGCVFDESGIDGAECRRKVLLGPYLMLGICSLSVLESCIKHCLYLFSCMTVRL